MTHDKQTDEKIVSFAESKSFYLNNLATHIMKFIELLQCQHDFEVSYKRKFFKPT